MTRYTPSRHYLYASAAAVGLAVLSGWYGRYWASFWVATALCVLSAGVLAWLALRPVIEVHESHLAIGGRILPWSGIRRLDRGGWGALLLVRLTLFDDTHVLLVYPGGADSAHSLLRHLRREARGALIDGIPYQRFWGESRPEEPCPEASPHYRMLLPEDEAEVERLYQRLKTVGRLDPKNFSDEQ